MLFKINFQGRKFKISIHKFRKWVLRIHCTIFIWLLWRDWRKRMTWIRGGFLLDLISWEIFERICGEIWWLSHPLFNRGDSFLQLSDSIMAPGDTFTFFNFPGIRFKFKDFRGFYLILFNHIQVVNTLFSNRGSPQDKFIFSLFFLAFFVCSLGEAMVMIFETVFTNRSLITTHAYSSQALNFLAVDTTQPSIVW